MTTIMLVIIALLLWFIWQQLESIARALWALQGLAEQRTHNPER